MSCQKREMVQKCSAEAASTDGSLPWAEAASVLGSERNLNTIVCSHIPLAELASQVAMTTSPLGQPEIALVHSGMLI